KWRLPENIVSAIAHHHSFGDKNSDELDDLIRLAVALNREIFAGSGHYLEDKITKIGVISSRLEISNRQLDDIALTIAKDAALFARATDIRIEDYGMILARANQEIFNTYLSIQKLFRERQELTRKLLDEERDRGLLEAKQVAISTLSHYINNAAMAISGNSQVIRMSLKHKNSDEIAATLPRVLDTMDGAVRKIAAVLEEISDLNQLDTMEYYDQSKILNIDDRIKKRMVKLEKASGVVLPDETELIVDSLTSK
ncbi:MAG: hypothetical protein NTV06_04285, partial [candidate division Zixibacteria bacterium]|nr:hypothetical protein [candidate division Zixibacteria bacterium]